MGIDGYDSDHERWSYFRLFEIGDWTPCERVLYPIASANFRYNLDSSVESSGQFISEKAPFWIGE